MINAIGYITAQRYMGKLSPLGIKRKSEDDNTGKKRVKSAEAEGGDVAAEKVRLPLSEVVSGCEERWFLETLREAKSGDIRMQVLVSQMYNSGYGVAKDKDKGKFWVSGTSQIRTSVRKVVNKRPGYNESDSDTDEWAGTS